MKFPVSCTRCSLEGKSNFITFLNYHEDQSYQVSCPEGHEFVIILQLQKFEILYDIGAYAIGDGYYREAVSSFASALERFYEFYIRYTCFKKQIPQAGVDASWKHMSNQSERQLGSFIFMYLMDKEESPKLLDNNLVKFRNGVIHKGEIPSRQKSIIFGQAVMDIIKPLLEEIKKDPISMVKYISHMINVTNKPPSSDDCSTVYVPTILSLGNADPKHNAKTLEECLNSLPYMKLKREDSY